MVWTYCQKPVESLLPVVKSNSNRDSNQYEMAGDAPNLFWWFLLPRMLLAGVWGRVEHLLGLGLS